MWIFTNTGFVSAVSDGKDLMVRARDHQSLEPLSIFAKSEIKKTPTHDYPYRVFVSHEIFSKWVSDQATAIRYKNFKSEVAICRGDSFAKPLLKVWSDMHDVEDVEARKK
jgi:hypothetical protein